MIDKLLDGPSVQGRVAGQATECTILVQLCPVTLAAGQRACYLGTMAQVKRQRAHASHGYRGMSPNAVKLRDMLESKFGPYAERAMDVLSDILEGKLETVEEKVDKDGHIVELVRKPSVGERYAAAELAMAYVNGRPAARLQVSGEEEDPSAMTDSALEAKVVGILTEVAKRRGYVEPAQLPEASEGYASPENGFGEALEADAELVEPDPDEDESDDRSEA